MTRPTLTFIGVTTQASSIMRVFPAWAEHWGLEADIRGLDLPLDASPDAYRTAVQGLKDDPAARGALVTTHKLDLFRAARPLFDEIDRFAALMRETSCLSKRPGEEGGAERMIAHAKDPITSGLAMEAMLPAGRMSDRREAFVMGAGGSGTAITWALMDRAANDRPSRIKVSDMSAERLEEIASVHAAIGTSVPVDYVEIDDAKGNDAILERLGAGAFVVNATGLGKDRPGSPLTDTARFPQAATVWELNYRGDLVFLDQARAQEASRSLDVHDGWTYFIHGWTSVIAEVFDMDLDARGPEMDVLTRIARAATA